MLKLGSRVYLDTNIFIYHLENVEVWSRQTESLFRRIDAGELVAVTSELALAECLVRPFAKQDALEIDGFQKFIENRGNLTVAPVSREILIEAARVRALSGMKLKLYDSIHLASAKLFGCDVLVTNDHRFDTPSGIPTFPLADVDAEF